MKKLNIEMAYYSFTIPCKNNFMERCFRMIKGKTKIFGVFKNNKDEERLANIMSIIIKKLELSFLYKEIYQGESYYLPNLLM